MYELWLVIGPLIGGLATAFVWPYLRKKGENLATKDDVAAITREVERVRLEYADRLENIAQENRLLLEQYRQKHQLSLAAIDKRLEAHQQAYALWRKFSTTAHDREEMGHLAAKCEDWWMKNCLYLNAEARQAFFIAWQAASHHKRLVEVGDPDQIHNNWMKIADAVVPILEAVALPSVSGGELGTDGKGKLWR